MMRALVVRQLTDDLSGVALEDVPTPVPGPGEVAIRVTAAGVNFPDYLMCQGKYQFKPDLPFTPGMEICGRVMARGAGVTDLAVDDRVTAGLRLGGFASVVVAPRDAIRPCPDGLSDEAAASFQATYMTAYVALVRRAALERGEVLLVHGAAGGVGLATVDLGLQRGATVIATASSPEKRAFLGTYGAHHVLAPQGFRDAVMEITSGRGADVIMDPVGGDVLEESVRSIAFDGRLLVVGFAGGRIASIKTNLALIKGFSLMGVRAGEYGRRFPERGALDRDVIWDLAQRGALRPHIHARFALDAAKDALLALSQREVIGKCVITP